MRLLVDVPSLLDRLSIEWERKGNHLWARCPFHTDANPSWRIRDQADHPAHGLHHCFSCEEGGSPVYLVQRMLELDTPRAAWLWIRSGANIERALSVSVSVEVSDPQRRREFGLPPGVVVAPLEHWSHKAKEYAVARNITADQVDTWGLGYAREGRLRGRLVIPIRDGFHRLRSYTARAWGNRDRKYLEPRTEEGADKSAVFGEECWPDERKVLVLSEGALNALAIERAAKRIAADVSVGALEGSQFVPGHALRVCTFETLVVAADPDKAGDKLRLALRSIGRWCKLRHMSFPPGMDACDVEKHCGLDELGLVLGRAL